MKYRLVATAGHVDHGKTALLKALTGQQTDRLEEEQQRGLTIDLGFADMRTDELHVGFVDVPGHHNFIKNMVSGVGSVQGILFVVSSVDGWQAQSREHFEIVRLLDPDFCCFALTKIDLADDDLQLLAQAELEDALADTEFEDAPLIPVSSETGDGVETLRTRLVEGLLTTPEPPDNGKPYCPVDRVFSVRGQGTVITGSLSGGCVEKDDELHLMPDRTPGRVRGIQQYHEPADRVWPGSRVALNVPDWGADRARRGHVATVPDAGQLVQRVDGRVQTPRRTDVEIKHDREILTYLGTRRLRGRVLIADQRTLGAAEREWGRIEWSEEVFTRPGDRVILRDFSDRHLLGMFEVGAVAPRRSLGDSSYRSWLGKRVPVTPESILVTRLEREGLCRLDTMARGTMYSTEQFRDRVESREGSLETHGEVVVDQNWWSQQRERIVETVRSYHEECPLRRGYPVAQLFPEIEDEALRSVLLELLEQSDLVVEETVVRDPGFEPELQPDQEQTFDELVEQTRASGLETDDRASLEDEFGEELVRYAIQTNTLVELGPERVIHREVLEELRQRLEQYMANNQPSRLSDLRDLFESSRKYVIPLMEYFDQEGTTYREGDVRYLRSPDESVASS